MAGETGDFMLADEWRPGARVRIGSGFSCLREGSVHTVTTDANGTPCIRCQFDGQSVAGWHYATSLDKDRRLIGFYLDRAAPVLPAPAQGENAGCECDLSTGECQEHFRCKQIAFLSAEVERLTKERDEARSRASVFELTVLAAEGELAPKPRSLAAADRAWLILHTAPLSGERLRADRDRMAEALREIERAESEYRKAHDTVGPSRMETGRAWDRLRRAGDKARAVLNAEQRDGG